MDNASLNLIRAILIIVKNWFKTLKLSNVLRVLKNVIDNVLNGLIWEFLTNLFDVFFLCSERLGKVPYLTENLFSVLLYAECWIFHVDYKEIYSLLQIPFGLLKSILCLRSWKSHMGNLLYLLLKGILLSTQILCVLLREFHCLQIRIVKVNFVIQLWSNSFHKANSLKPY